MVFIVLSLQYYSVCSTHYRNNIIHYGKCKLNLISTILGKTKYYRRIQDIYGKLGTVGAAEDNPPTIVFIFYIFSF